MAVYFQFSGTEDVINAYISRNVPSFAIWYGKQLLFPFVCKSVSEGQAVLQQFLDSISNGSNLVYTLKVYEDLDNGKIKERTEADGSFNFQLNSEQHQERIQHRMSGINNEVISRLAAIENKLEGGKMGSEELSTLDHIKDFCDTDAGKIAVPQIVGAILSAIFPGSRPVQPMQLPQTTLGTISGITPNDGRITKAIETLKRHDAKLDEHLEKLALIAETNPSGFQSLIAILDQM